MSARDLGTPAALQRFMGTAYPLSDEQFAAVTAPLEPQLVIAGAGSGKTTVMAARVVWLVATGQVAPGEVLGLTFTTKAAGELGQRVRQVLRQAGLLPAPGETRAGADGEPTEAEEPTVSTYHAYAAGLLAEHGLRLGHEPDTRVLADASRYQLGARALAEHHAGVAGLSDHPDTVITWLLGLDAMMSEHLAGPEEVAAEQDRVRRGFEATAADPPGKADRTKALQVLGVLARRDELLELVAAYRRLKADLGLMDFSDQIELGARLAIEHPEVGALERDRFKVVLLDEYQDTSVAQALMLGHLFSGPDRASGRGHPVTAVGDPNQAIYGWRGASVSNILNFGDAFPPDGPDSTPVLSLATNRRSGRRILEVANALARPLLDATPEVRPLVPDPASGPGEVEVCVHETREDELVWLATEVRAARERRGSGWREVAVLTRDNKHAAAVFDALTEADVPVEIVGLKGLLRLPEVAEVLATLRLLGDLTANDALITLLTGPRWAIGPRDLSLLGRRARELAGRGATRDLDLDAALDAAVAGSDPTDVTALGDALESPGDLPYSAQARERFALLAAELRRLRRHVGEPLLDVVRRVLETSGLDLELDAATSPSARARRDNLDLFVQAVADFQGFDGTVSLPALLAYLEAEEDGTGLDVAVPSQADSVKLLTVHRAKGLEWDTVFVVGACAGRFPTTTARPSWLTTPAVLPVALRGDRRDLPELAAFTRDGVEASKAGLKAVEASEELRLGYVALTRPRHHLVVSSYVWGDRKTPYGPSPYQLLLRDVLAGWGETCETWAEEPEPDVVNPLTEGRPVRTWPAGHALPEVVRRRAAAAAVRAVIAQGDSEPATPEATDLSEEEAVLVAAWDSEAERLVEESLAGAASVQEVPLPSSLSATALARLRDDPATFAAELARPMPRDPSPAARFGTRFHATLEARFGQQQLLGLDEVPGRGDAEVDDEDDLAALLKAFDAGPFGDRVPLAVEPSFATVVGGQVLRGRIDAVYDDSDRTGVPDSVLLVDWKTNRRHDADPLQLAVYRMAWSELHGLDPVRVRAAFFYVRDGALVEPPPEDLPDRAGLERLLDGSSRG